MYLIVEVQDKVCQKMFLYWILCSETNKENLLFSPEKLSLLLEKAYSRVSGT